MACGRLNRAEGDQFRATVRSLLNILRFQSPAAKRNLPDLLSLRLEKSPREVIGAVLALSDENALSPLGLPELGGDQPGSRTHGRHQGDVLRLGADDPREGTASPLPRFFGP